MSAYLCRIVCFMAYAIPVRNAAEEISAAFCFLFGWGRGGATQSTLELQMKIVNIRAIAPVVNALYTGIKDNALYFLQKGESV